MTWIKDAPKKLTGKVFAFVRAELLLVAALAVIAAALLAFIEIADEMTEGEAHGFDMAVLQALHPDPANPSDPVGPRWLDHAAADITALGSVSILTAMTIAVAGFLMLRRRWVETVIVAAAAAGGLAWSEILKAYFSRERPPEIYRATEILNTSFPSGHALMSAVVFLTLGAMLAQATKSEGIRIYVMAVAMVLVFLVGVTRVYLGVHWTTDVLAGWSVGAAWATACWLTGRWVRDRRVSARKAAP